MTRSRLAISVHAVLFSIALAFVVTLLTPANVSACGTVGTACCLPGNSCNAGLQCTSGICTVIAPPPPGPPAGTITLTNPMSGTSDVRGLIERFVTILRDFATPIAILMILFGAFRILTAAGDPAKFETGKKILLYAAIGYAIIFIGWGITSIIESLLSS